MLLFIKLQPCTKDGEARDEPCFVRADQIVGVRAVAENGNVSFVRTLSGNTHYVQYAPDELVQELEHMINERSFVGREI